MKRQCFICDGTGQKCQACGESEAVCDGYCDPEHGGLIDCPDCKGTGVASADLPGAKKPKRKDKP